MWAASTPSAAKSCVRWQQRVLTSHILILLSSHPNRFPSAWTGSHARPYARVYRSTKAMATAVAEEVETKLTVEEEVYDIHADVSEVLYTEEQIAEKIREMGAQVAADYKDKMPVISPILKGGFVVAADLLRAMRPCPAGMEVEFVQASSYGNHTVSSGKVAVSFNEHVMKGRHVVLVDDLCDSGLTLQTVHDLVLRAGAASVRSLVLLDKKERRKVDFVPDYIGFQVPNKWLVGAGMDTCQLYRGLSYIGVLHTAACKRVTGN